MVIPVGSLVNAGAVVVGAGLGLAAGGLISERTRETLFQVLGLCTMMIGMKMALTAQDQMAVIISCVLGGLTGEMLRLADRLARLGDQVKRLVKSENEKFTDGLVTTSVVVCVGAMAIVGSLEEGLGGSRTTLFSKSILDFCMAMMMASAYGVGVAVAAVPLLIYQGSLTILAGVAAPLLTEGIRSALVATGGLLILAIGLNLLGVRRLSVENLLPALLYAVFFGVWLG